MLELGPAVAFGIAYLVKTKPAIGVPVAVGVGLTVVAVGVTSQFLDDEVGAPSARPHSIDKPNEQELGAPQSTSILGYELPSDRLVYIVPVALAPFAHILISLGISSSKGSFVKAKPYVAGALLVTAGAFAQRIYLMNDAGIDSSKHSDRPGSRQ